MYSVVRPSAFVVPKGGCCRQCAHDRIKTHVRPCNLLGALIQSRILMVNTRSTLLTCHLSTTWLDQQNALIADELSTEHLVAWNGMVNLCQACRTTPLTRCHAVPVHASQLHSVRSAWQSLQSTTLLRYRTPPRRHHALQAAGDGDPARRNKQRSDSAATLTDFNPAVALGGSWAAYGSLIIAAQAFRLHGGCLDDDVPLTVREQCSV